jgi:3-oxoacyl-[acyl-carrier-protein] synthase III
MSLDVFITRTSSHLPLAPVNNDEMENVLGKIGGVPSRARRVILRSNGIVSRHYALDPASGEPVMTGAQLAARAVQDLGQDVLQQDAIDCLATGTSIPDQLLPGHGVMVHAELNWPQLEVVSLSGICLAGAAALKYAFMSVASGNAKRAVACASELISPLLRARNFEAESLEKVNQLGCKPELAFEKDFLRWMLSDGAGAMLLETRPGSGLSFKIKWIDLFSNAHRLPACMYAGAEKNSDGSLIGWAQVPVSEWTSKSIFSIKQDVRLLNENIASTTLIDPLKAIMARRALKPEHITWFLPHFSSQYFSPVLERALNSINFIIPRERWFSNLTSCGNTGAASPFIMLDALAKSGRIQTGDTLLLFVPESGRFSSGFILLEAV